MKTKAADNSRKRNYEMARAALVKGLINATVRLKSLSLHNWIVGRPVVRLNSVAFDCHHSMAARLSLRVCV